MRLKNAVFLAFIGALLMAVLLIFGLVHEIVGVVRGLQPAMQLFVSIIETFAGICAAIFFYVFYRDQH